MQIESRDGGHYRGSVGVAAVESGKVYICYMWGMLEGIF
jgi:hypothetical protein